jgi:hypothetical protein
MLETTNRHRESRQKVRLGRQIKRIYSNPILVDSPYPLWYYPRVLANIM